MQPASWIARILASRMDTKATSAEPGVWKILPPEPASLTNLSGFGRVELWCRRSVSRSRSSNQTSGFRSRLSDQGRFMLSPTGACAWPVPAECRVDKGGKEVGFSNCNSLTSRKARLTGEQVFIRAAIASRGAERPYYSSTNTNIANNLASLQ